jgi:hypothetical protein
MVCEIWASDSSNRLLTTSDLDEALKWVIGYWLREGDPALDALSVGDELDRWVVQGPILRELLRARTWGATPALEHFGE